MPDNKIPNELDSDESLETLPEDLGLEDEIRKISRKVNRIMKNVEEANATIQAIITPVIEQEALEDSSDPTAKDDVDTP